MMVQIVLYLKLKAEFAHLNPGEGHLARHRGDWIRDVVIAAIAKKRQISDRLLYNPQCMHTEAR